MNYYVNHLTKTAGDGGVSHPFRTIQQAANIALPGDVITVAPGIYREHVKPINAGSVDAPIKYVSETPLEAIITGAESIKDWEKVEGTTWKVSIDNEAFGDYNPYIDKVSGDWLLPNFSHTGDVYLNHKSLYEVESLELVKEPVASITSWDPDFSVYTWYTEQDETNNRTLIYANFHEFDPNKEDVEISFRKNCFMPTVNGINYITLSGFTVREAACQWAPPTAYQDGMIGPHWSKGWVIEDCEIYEAKCSGISLGKYLQKDNDNKWLKNKYKDGTQTERDCICRASYEGWDKEHIGSHTVRRCHIHDCGQTGIVGHLGGVFSLIEDNHIHNINNKQNLSGAEIGGIKMHAAIDVIYRHNHIHHCTRGLWLDWQAQGTRVTGNLFHDNCLCMDRSKITTDNFALFQQGMGEDIFVEVSHGPTLIDNNLLLSERSCKLATQGIALVHNLIAGSLTCVGTGTNNGAHGMPSPRFTPYHGIHGTTVEGFMTILHGDTRIYNNIIIQQPIYPVFKEIQEWTRNAEPEYREWDTMNFEAGNDPYSEYPTLEEWETQFKGWCGMGAKDFRNKYYGHLPVWTLGNVFFNGAKPSAKEVNGTIINEKVSFTFGEENGVYKLHTDLFKYLPDDCKLISTNVLGKAFEPEEYYENPDGTPIIFGRDIYNKKRNTKIIAGPFVEKKEEYTF